MCREVAWLKKSKVLRQPPISTLRCLLSKHIQKTRMLIKGALRISWKSFLVLQTERREEDKKMRRPAAAMEKRPAMKRPGAAPSLSTASSVQKKDPKKPDKKGIYWKGNITQKERMKMMPRGCSTCRYKRGCTDSSWKKRHYWPV